jgi:hypothetical protein
MDGPANRKNLVYPIPGDVIILSPPRPILMGISPPLLFGRVVEGITKHGPNIQIN